MSANREMTLNEWMRRLHRGHLARRQLAGIRRNLRRYMRKVAEQNRAAMMAATPTK